MSRITVDLPQHSYDIISESGALDRAGELLRPVLRGKLAVIITDSNVEPLYAGRLARSLHLAGFRPAVLEIPAGEQSKTPQVLAELWEQMADLGITRTDSVIALGGGVPGDLGGFAAATILRGVDFVQIPTTLLAQVDSSVGGKTAVDLQAGKNLAGSFYQPKMVIMDPDTLGTLPDREFSGGMAEVIKYGCICDRAFFDRLAEMGSRKAVEPHLSEITLHCCQIKAGIVERDERESGERKLLNFGHTYGHIVEHAGQYTKWIHGEAVAAGMVKAARIGTALGITPEGTAEEIEAVLKKFNLPTDISVRAEDVDAALAVDKKSDGSEISLVVLEKIGKAALHRIDKKTLASYF